MLNEWSTLKSVEVISTDKILKFFYFKSNKHSRHDVYRSKIQDITTTALINTLTKSLILM